MTATITTILKQLSSKQYSDETLEELINYSRNSITDEEIAELAIVLAESGERIEINSERIIADIPSTGGPSSLSTLVCPLLLKDLRAIVPKLGIPGRPAGGIDVMAQIEGYCINPSKKILEKWIKDSGFAHFISGGNYTPIDGQLFAYRKKTNNIDIPALVIASILSKKIAAGLNHTALEIRVSETGNFGKDWGTAKKNAERFILVSRIVGINSICFLSDNSYAYQPYIGRGEALVALRMILENIPNKLLESHFKDCCLMAGSVLRELKYIPEIENIKNVFIENLIMQGSNYDKFTHKTDEIVAAHEYYFEAKCEGIIKINLHDLRSLLMRYQGNENNSLTTFGDQAGIILKKNTGDYIFKGDIICSYRCPPEYQIDFMNGLENIFLINSGKPINKQTIQLIK